ncbi:DUF4004 family protein [Bacillus salitolerans]|uniref:DUF4004 family protein n=1 Tax=Bacillus salitolerans TaxID=1437434 RepID=A0ABW4LIY9_9BACI
MDDHLISKKELLEQTGISYGQLYRWKRMEIIPESWFIKKSSFTGQETFFPREKIVERVSKILQLKDDYSLEDLAKFFSPNPSEVELTIDEMLDYKIVDERTVDYFKSMGIEHRKIPFKQMLYMSICELSTKKSLLPLEEVVEKLEFVRDYYDSTGNLASELIGITINGEIVWMLLPLQTPVVVETNANVTVHLNLLDHINNLKILLSNIH